MSSLNFVRSAISVVFSSRNFSVDDSSRDISEERCSICDNRDLYGSDCSMSSRAGLVICHSQSRVSKIWKQTFIVICDICCNKSDFSRRTEAHSSFSAARAARCTVLVVSSSAILALFTYKVRYCRTWRRFYS